MGFRKAMREMLTGSCCYVWFREGRTSVWDVVGIAGLLDVGARGDWEVKGGGLKWNNMPCGLLVNGRCFYGVVFLAMDVWKWVVCCVWIYIYISVSWRDVRCSGGYWEMVFGGWEGVEKSTK